jgi:hypothetical protein
MYFKIAKVGDINKALDIEFAKINSPLKAAIDHYEDAPPFTYARIENKTKFSQVYITAEGKIYLPDFWKDGVCLANGSISDITQLAKAIDFWLSNSITTKQLSEKFSFVKLTDKAIAFDEGIEIEYTWNFILNNPSMAELKDFVSLAIKDEILRWLFPFTSLNRLCFSRCTGYPYTNDTPIVVPVTAGIFEVRLYNNKLVGRGTAAEALAIVRQNLPSNIGKAVKGTADDL